MVTPLERPLLKKEFVSFLKGATLRRKNLLIESKFFSLRVAPMKKGFIKKSCRCDPGKFTGIFLVKGLSSHGGVPLPLII